MEDDHRVQEDDVELGHDMGELWELITHAHTGSIMLRVSVASAQYSVHRDQGER